MEIKKVIDVAKIAEFLNLEFLGEGSTEIVGPCSLQSTRADRFLFIRDKKYISSVKGTIPGCAIIKKEWDNPDIAASRIFSNDPQLDFVRALSLFYPEPELISQISSNSSIAHDVTVSPKARIDDFVTVGEGSIVSERVWLGAGAKIGKNVLIGSGTTIHPNVVIYDGTVIGRNVIIHSNSTIGADGFGYLFRNNKQIKIPQIGNVMIGNEVEIGANVTIDRAALDSTLIGDGTKIDNLVQIAHNCKIGKSCAFSAQVGLSGHTDIGDNCLVGGQVGTGGHLSVGSNSIIYAKSGLAKSFPPKSQIFGTPAKDFQAARSEMMNIMKIPRLLTRIKKLEEFFKKEK